MNSKQEDFFLPFFAAGFDHKIYDAGKQGENSQKKPIQFRSLSQIFNVIKVKKTIF